MAAKEDHHDFSDTCDSLAALLRAPTSTAAVAVNAAPSTAAAAAVIVDDTIGEKGHIIINKYYCINHYGNAPAATPSVAAFTAAADEQKKRNVLEWLVKTYKLCGPIIAAVKTIKTITELVQKVWKKPQVKKFLSFYWCTCGSRSSSGTTENPFEDVWREVFSMV